MEQEFESLLNPEVQAFIRDNLDKSAGDLLLKKQPWTGTFLKEIVNQIECKKKAKNKLPTWFEKEGVIFPSLLSMEQCSSEQTAQYKKTILKGNTLVDLTGGFGVDDFAFKQVFRTVHYVEMNQELASRVKHNASVFGLDSFVVHATTAEELLGSFSEQVDAFYIDPARRDTNKQKVFRFADCVPDIVGLQESLLKQAKMVLVKASPLMDLKQGLSELKHVAEIHVVALQNECKEVLFLLKKDFVGSPLIKTINLVGGNQSFDFSLTEEENSVSELGNPLKYLYEPNAAILKAGAFKSVGKHFGLKKLHQHSHLYTSDSLVNNFPGRIFEVKEISKADKKSLLQYLPEGKANITVRNFSLTVYELRKKTGLKDGGSHYLFATTLFDQSHVVLICSKV